MRINLFKVCFFFLFSFSIIAKADAQDTLRVSAFSPKQNLIPLATIISTSDKKTPDEIWKLMFTDNSNALKLKNTTVGFTADIYWLGFVIQNDSKSDQNKILEIDNPQIDYLNIYQIHSNGSVDTLVRTGDKLSFYERPLLNRNFLLPVQLQQGETISLLIEIDKRNSTLNFPVSIWDAAVHSQKDYHQNLGFGLFFGMILLCMIYALLAFIFLRKSIYFYYFFWVIYSGLYVFTALGFSLQYLYPYAVDFNSYFRVYLQVSGFVVFIKFVQEFLSIRQYSPSLNKALNFSLYLFLGLMALSVINLKMFEDNSKIVLPIINSIFLLCGTLVFCAAVFSYKKQKRIVLFFLSAFGMLLVGIGLTILAEFGVVAVEHFWINPVMGGAILELLTFSIALTYQIKKVYDERNELSIKMAKQQKDLLRAYVDGVEKERDRISRELHDDIGSRLSSLKRFLTKSGDQTESLQQQIDLLCTDVRTMSHQLSPPSLKIAGLKQMIIQLAAETSERNEINVDVQFYDFPETLSEELTHHLYRIVQEAVNNIIKHAKATETDIQFFLHESEWVITIEDNGKGFDSTSLKGGIGLKNIKARTESLNGTFDISSSPGRGTNIMIRIPNQLTVTAQ